MPSAFYQILCVLFAFVLSAEAEKNLNTTPALPSPAAISKAANVSTGNPSKCANGTKYFPQPIDHSTFNGNWDDKNSTFLQQYQVIDDLYKPGGPILFYQGAETVRITCAEYLSLYEWGKELGALLIVIEHRYFGISCPYGLNYTERAGWNPDLLKDLTLDNVYMDSISLLNWVKSAYPATKDAKVIAYGGSYGGFLSALWRLNHPEWFYGAIASSTPTKGIISDPLDPGIYGFGDWADMVYNDYSSEASKKINDSMVELRARMAAGQFDGLQQQLHLCTPPKNLSQVDQLVRTIVSIYAVNLQYNVAENGYPFYQAINATLTANDSTAVLGASIAIFNSWHQQSCMDWQPDLTAVDPFNYLRCTYFPIPDVYTAPESIWGPSLPDFSFKHVGDRVCQPAFGIDSIDGGPEYQRKIGVDQDTLENTSRLLVVLSTMDPTTSYGPDSWNPGHDRDHSRIIMVNSVAHAADGAVAHPYDPESLTQARLFELNSMKSWLGMV